MGLLTPRDIEKLQALGYEEVSGVICYGEVGVGVNWEEAKAHAQSPDGMKATMADKVRWLARNVDRWPGPVFTQWADVLMSENPEATAHALWEKVP